MGLYQVRHLQWGGVSKGGVGLYLQWGGVLMSGVVPTVGWGVEG